MAWLLDTNVIAETRRPAPNRRVLAFIKSCPFDQLYISSVILAEIRFGADIAPDPNRRAELEKWLAGTIRPMLIGQVLEITEDIMLRWRHLVEESRAAGRTYPQPDLILAATALEYGLVLVTRNVKDFAGLPVTILNPWDE